MNRREGLLLLLTGTAAFVAAFSFHGAVHPEELHDPVHARPFEEVRRALPILGAVRVKSNEPHAAHKIATARGRAGYFSEVVDPSGAAAVFRYGRLLYASAAGIEAVHARLKAGLPPRRLPPSPDIGKHFREDRSYSCFVILDGLSGLDAIREALPDAEVSGEPVVREAERRRADGLARALALVLVAVCGWFAWRGKPEEAQRRVLSALLPLALLGLVGWGVDIWTLAAIAIVTAAPRGFPLLGVLPLVFFPALAIRRMGLVLALGALVRFDPPPGPVAGGSRRGPVALLAILGLAAVPLVLLFPPRSRPSVPLPRGLAVTLVPAAEAASRAAALSAEGLAGVIGGENLLPPDHDSATLYRLRKIHLMATALAKAARSAAEQARFEMVAEASAVESLYLPRDLRLRMRARDGRVALRVDELEVRDRAEFTSSALYRLRGADALARDAAVAAVLVLLAGGAYLAYRRGVAATVPLLARFGGLLGGGALLHWEGDGPAWMPLLAAAVVSPSWLVAPALGCAAVALPTVYFWPAVAFAVASGAAILGDRFSRR